MEQNNIMRLASNIDFTKCFCLIQLILNSYLNSLNFNSFYSAIILLDIFDS